MVHANIPSDIGSELKKINDIAHKLRLVAPKDAQELNAAVSYLRQLLSKVLQPPSATARIKAGFGSLSTETLDES